VVVCVGLRRGSSANSFSSLEEDRVLKRLSRTALLVGALVLLLVTVSADLALAASRAPAHPASGNPAATTPSGNYCIVHAPAVQLGTVGHLLPKAAIQKAIAAAPPAVWDCSYPSLAALNTAAARLSAAEHGAPPPPQSVRRLLPTLPSGAYGFISHCSGYGTSGSCGEGYLWENSSGGCEYQSGGVNFFQIYTLTTFTGSWPNNLGSVSVGDGCNTIVVRQYSYLQGAALGNNTNGIYSLGLLQGNVDSLATSFDCDDVACIDQFGNN
jgi:hypothetical protein